MPFCVLVQAHMVMDAKSTVKLLELWAREARAGATADDPSSPANDNDEVLLGPAVLDEIGTWAPPPCTFSPSTHLFIIHNHLSHNHQPQQPRPLQRPPWPRSRRFGTMLATYTSHSGSHSSWPTCKRRGVCL